MNEEVFEAAKKHARSAFPEESCGIVVKGAYLPCENAAQPAETHKDEPDCPCRLCCFVIKKEVLVSHIGQIEMVLHSHPNGPEYPSVSDIEGQMAMDIPWGIIPLDDERISDPLIWGADTPIQPLLGRQFVHFTADCYTLIRDAFRCGKDNLEAQGVSGWPYPPIELPEFPREDGWWSKSDKDFYNEEPSKIGFREIPASEARPGDVFLTSIKSEKLNHGGILIGNDLIVHHLPARLSRREPASIWARAAKRWLRFEYEASDA